MFDNFRVLMGVRVFVLQKKFTNFYHFKTNPNPKIFTTKDLHS